MPEIIKYIDLCCGIGGFRVGLQQSETDDIKFQCVFSADIKPDAIKIYNLNFNEDMKKTDLYEVELHQIPSFDLLCAGFPCFVQGTPVLTNNGYKPIETVTFDDKLLTHTGQFQSIVNLQRKLFNGTLCSITVKHQPDPIICTEEHPFYVRTKHNPPQWKMAKDITCNDYVGMVITNWFDESEWINMSEKIGRTCIQVPEWVYDVPNEYIEEFIYYYSSNPNTTLELALGIQRLYLKMGYIVSIEKLHNEYHINEKNIQDAFIDGDYAWCPLTDPIITHDVVDEPVYNFEVDQDNSYIVSNTIVHNCQPFSSSGNKKGFSDSRGGMIFKILDICKHHRPTTFILENVSNLLTIEKGECIRRITNMFIEIGYNLSYRKLNGLDFGIPQSRERIFIVGTIDRTIDLSKIEYMPSSVLNTIIDYTARYTDIPPLFADRLLELHQQKCIFGFKVQDKRGGNRNIHSWDILDNLSRDELDLMELIMLERRKKHWAIEKGIEWMDGMPLTTTEIQTFYAHPKLQTLLDHLVDLEYLKLEKCKDLVNGKREYKQDSECGYNICKGKLSFPVSQILDPNGVSPTLTATDCCKLVVIIDNRFIRKLTPLELKRLCGYPDEFKIIKDVNYFDLFGNTVLPPIIKQLSLLIYSDRK